MYKSTATIDTAAIRRQLYYYMEVAEDKKVKAIYTLMESALKECTAG